VGVFILPLCRLTLSRHRLHPENPGLSSRKCHGTCTNIPQTDSTLSSDPEEWGNRSILCTNRPDDHFDDLRIIQSSSKTAWLTV
jgi:hypothetical protein